MQWPNQGVDSLSSTGCSAKASKDVKDILPELVARAAGVK